MTDLIEHLKRVTDDLDCLGAPSRWCWGKHLAAELDQLLEDCSSD